MPELPEVETTRRGIEPRLLERRITAVTVRQRQLRWPVSRELTTRVPGSRIKRVSRRAKYLLIETTAGTVLLHLGMSGSLQLVPADRPAQKHDHLDLVTDEGLCLRFTDPRRFGAALWCGTDAGRHRLLRDLGPEPLGNAFDGDHLRARAQGRRVAVKNFIMDAKVVVGVGNIYASEALFASGIHPGRAAGRVSRPRYQRLAQSIRSVLQEAIDLGGTTLRDFVDPRGAPGYFGARLRVYGRADEPCVACGRAIRQRPIGQRSSFYCASCQR